MTKRLGLWYGGHMHLITNMLTRYFGLSVKAIIQRKGMRAKGEKRVFEQDNN